MTTEWFFSKSGQQQGPVSTEQLKQLAASGQLHPGEPRVERRDGAVGRGPKDKGTVSRTADV